MQLRQELMSKKIKDIKYQLRFSPNKICAHQIHQEKNTISQQPFGFLMSLAKPFDPSHMKGKNVLFHVFLFHNHDKISLTYFTPFYFEFFIYKQCHLI